MAINASDQPALQEPASAGLVGGAVLGASFSVIVTQAAPEQWAWPEKRVARVLHRDMWSAGERMLATADLDRWREFQIAGRIFDQNREVLAWCLRAADAAKAAARCQISVKTVETP